MSSPANCGLTDTLVAEVLAAFGLGPASQLQPLGGTATRKWDVLAPQGRFVVRRRPREFADSRAAGFDHAVLRRLAAAGFPVPCPAVAPNGLTVLVRDGEMYEVLRWVAGGPFPEGDPRAIAELGAFLARFHKTLASDFPAGKEERLREDHPNLLTPYLVALQDLAADAEQQRQLAAIDAQLAQVRHQVDEQLYANLPRAIIHGDFHPGNVRFQGTSVAALYDFDYLGVQARVRDVSDALMFFASRRRQTLDADDIHSLTQPFVPEVASCLALLAGYQSVSRLTEAEWEALPWLIRSRWLQMRLRGSRKVPNADKVPFVLDRFFEVIDWLNGQGVRFFPQLRREAV